MVIRLDKDTLSCRKCRRKIETALWVIWIKLGFSEKFCDAGLSCIIYTRNSGLPVRDRFFENFRKSKYRSKFLAWFLRITHPKVSLGKLWAIRKNWSCPKILDGYRKSLLKSCPPSLGGCVQCMMYVWSFAKWLNQTSPLYRWMLWQIAHFTKHGKCKAVVDVPSIRGYQCTRCLF